MKCRKCGNEYDASPYDVRKSDFMCMGCRRQYQAEWREKRINEGLPAYGSRTWDPEKKKAYQEKRKHDPQIKKYNADRMREYSKNPRVRKKSMARWMINHMKQSGSIKSEPCAFCGEEPSQAHHPDYDKPLLIVWLCANCHRKIHPRQTDKDFLIAIGDKGHKNKWAGMVHQCCKNTRLREGHVIKDGSIRCGACGKIKNTKAEGRP
jgi:hypothetical protein